MQLTNSIDVVNVSASAVGAICPFASLVKRIGEFDTDETTRVMASSITESCVSYVRQLQSGIGKEIYVAVPTIQGVAEPSVAVSACIEAMAPYKERSVCTSIEHCLARIIMFRKNATKTATPAQPAQ